ncbi:DUF6344 domain-containing protein [Streptomyces sp. FIT100]|uniref:DUF6344 domain-containing protein n=1 Tax=Streptomyces sp. FIT100 TaxID=2837956 RepID=UPI0021C9BC56|nr:DUF6344 domain-containing protein [Streptomyces sp. FIT100]UUN28024.1 hypothetical protein KK483_17755 [Streptomyces sp. FIT100]
MAAVKVKMLWTAFFSLLVALLAQLGFATPAASAAQQPATRRPEEPAARKTPQSADARHGQRHDRHQAVIGRQRSPWDRSLPPTIKQRIRAEAHGATPSVRHLPAAPETVDDLLGIWSQAADSAPAAAPRTGDRTLTSPPRTGDRALTAAPPAPATAGTATAASARSAGTATATAAADRTLATVPRTGHRALPATPRAGDTAVAPATAA